MANNHATKRNNSAPPARQPLPGWIWLLTGVAMGAFVMFLMHLSQVNVPNKSTTATAPKTAKTSPPAEEKSVPKPRFDFYKLLKENEVPVTTPQSQTSTSSNTAQAEPEPQLEYILQAGSFQKPEEADRLRAQLLLLNLNAQVEAVNMRTGVTWHRVLVGPFQSRSKMAAARSALASQNISPLLLKRKVGG